MRPVVPFPIAVREEDFFVVDRSGRIAILDPAARRPLVRCDHALEPGAFIEWVLMPLIHAALCDASATVIHASAVQSQGHRIMIAGVSGSGKSIALFSLLGSGAGFLADDCIAINKLGVVAPLQASLSMSGFHWSLVPGRHSRSITERLRPRRRKSVSLDAAFPEAVRSDFGKLDSLWLLTSSAAEPKHVAEIITMHRQLEFHQCSDIEVAFRATHPGKLYDSLFPSIAEQQDLIESALRDVDVRIIDDPHEIFA
ncbi:MAG: hypothetical protein ACYDCC_09890 [Actinomycetota bacterium]